MVLAAVAALSLAAPPPRWVDLDDPGRTEAMAELRSLPLSGRLLRASERFLGTPYGTSPLGEGEGVDPDPRLRWDRVDCVTLVEETMAVALARSAASLLDVLDHIRYRGEILPTERDDYITIAKKNRLPLIDASRDKNRVQLDLEARLAAHFPRVGE